MWRELANAFREAWQASQPHGGSYRPDLHYMRGPGPKCRARQAGFVAATLPVKRSLAMPHIVAELSRSQGGR